VILTALNSEEFGEEHRRLACSLRPRWHKAWCRGHRPRGQRIRRVRNRSHQIRPRRRRIWQFIAGLDQKLQSFGGGEQTSRGKAEGSAVRRGKVREEGGSSEARGRRQRGEWTVAAEALRRARRGRGSRGVGQGLQASGEKC
jgi:hypothetical protein